MKPSPSEAPLMEYALATALLRIASDPARVTVLHDLLGGFCHQSRNVLNCMKLGFYLFKHGGDSRESEPLVRDLEPHYLDIERLFDQLQTICRPMALAVVELPIDYLIDEHRGRWEASLSGRGRHLELSPSPVPSVARFDPTRLGQALDAFVEWRAEAGPAGRPVQLRWKTEDDQLCLDWEEPDAPRLVPSTPVCGRCESLALPLMARVVAAHGGRLSLDLLDGFRVGLRWPRDASLATRVQP